MKIYDLIIIGAGPAGLAAGLYAGRFRLDTLILEKAAIGGQIILSPSIENYPGFPGGISTQELMEKFKAQVDSLNVPIIFEEVAGVSCDTVSGGPVYKVKTSLNLYSARSLVVACGAQPKRLGVEGEEQLTGRGVSYCGTCDGPLFKNKEVVVVGGGDRALEEVLFLAGYASKVTIVHRRKDLRASFILQEGVRKSAKVNFLLERVIEKIEGKNRVEVVVLKNVSDGSLERLSCQGVFIFVGIVPETAFLKNILQRDESGFIITQPNFATSAEGVFACGDCIQKGFYQVISAVSEGASCVFAAHRYLMRGGGKC
jgi:thioredoxin reductase (NADPH)